MKNSYFEYSRKERGGFKFDPKKGKIYEELRKLQDKVFSLYIDLSFMCRSDGALREFEERLDMEMLKEKILKSIKIEKEERVLKKLKS